MKFLTQEQILALSYKQCQKQLKTLTSTYNLEEPLVGNPNLESIWVELEDICNNLLWLEDQIYKYESNKFTTMVPD
jgi:hypothetical protein